MHIFVHFDKSLIIDKASKNMFQLREKNKHFYQLLI